MTTRDLPGSLSSTPLPTLERQGSPAGLSLHFEPEVRPLSVGDRIEWHYAPGVIVPGVVTDIFGSNLAVTYDYNPWDKEGRTSKPGPSSWTHFGGLGSLRLRRISDGATFHD